MRKPKTFVVERNDDGWYVIVFKIGIHVFRTTFCSISFHECCTLRLRKRTAVKVTGRIAFISTRKGPEIEIHRSKLSGDYFFYKLSWRGINPKVFYHVTDLRLRKDKQFKRRGKFIIKGKIERIKYFGS